MHNVTKPILAALLAALSVLAAAPASAEVAPDAQEAVRTIVFPVAGRVSYGDTFGACRSGCARGHEGTDIMAAKLTVLVAARDAEVVWLKDTATPDGAQGNYVMLEDADGWRYFYVHVNNDSPGTDDGANPPVWMFAPGIEVGATVRAGEPVGFVGDSGNAEGTAPHLHFEVHKPDGTVVNPYRSLRSAPVVLPAALPADTPTRRLRSFAEALYHDFLGRDAGDVEVTGRAAQVVSGRSRGQVVHDFAGSDEWAGALVDGYYRSTLGRAADPAGREFWLAELRAGTTPAKVAAEFYASDEYHRLSGGNDRAWVEDLYAELLLREPDAAGVDYWAAQAATTPRQQIAEAFYQSPETRRVRVSGLYGSLLGRDPDTAGLLYWADVLTDGNDLRLATFLASSDEYLARAHARFGGTPT